MGNCAHVSKEIFDQRNLEGPEIVNPLEEGRPVSALITVSFDLNRS